MKDPLHYEISDRVATLTLNRPEKRNALSADLVGELLQRLDDADADPQVGALLLTGAGDKAFCAGGDLSGVSGDGFLAQHEGRRVFIDLLARLRRLRKPIVGAANGHALGGGFGLLLACDFVVVRRDARYGTPEIKRGLFPMTILAVLLRTLGRQRTQELALLGREVDGDTLERWGAANRSVAGEDVPEAAREYAQQAASLSPSVMALGRRAIATAEDMGFAEQLEYLLGQLTVNTLLEDAAEGLTAFFQKRDPTWTGR
jgi:enoyl-CoA hydratase/carnithine racemase